MRNRKSRMPILTFSSLESKNMLAGISLDVGSGVVTIDGSSGDDTAYVFNHSESEVRVILDGFGNQVFQRTSVSEVIFRGKAGDDHFANQTHLNSRAFGHKGDDTLIGGSSDDVLRGGRGLDRIEGRGGNDFIGGGHDRDVVLAGAGNDVVNGSLGNDFIQGQSGNDLINAGSGDDTVLGGEGDDTIYGRNGNDLLQGGSGNDHLEGLNGDDIVEGNLGNDRLYGNAGRDQLFGGMDDDRLFGGSSSDMLFGHQGLDSIVGGPGNDDLSGGSEPDELRGGSGNDDYDSDSMDSVFDDSEDFGIDGDFEIRGRVANLNQNTRTFEVLGIGVDYSNAEFVATIQNGSFVKVEGGFDGQSLNSHEVELEQDDRLENFEARGIIENHNPNSRMFVFFGFNVNYSNAQVEGPIVDGSAITVEGRLTANTIDAHRIQSASMDANGDNSDGDVIGDIELRGFISNLNESNSTFSLLGLTVDFSSSQLFGNLNNGSFVKVDGRINGTEIVAREVELEINDDRDENFEGYGRVLNLNTNNQTFELFGFLVDYSGAEIEGNLVNESLVALEGRLANGNIVAEEIR